MHIVVLPFPIQGHLSPFFMLARLLEPQGFTFTFVVTEELAAKLKGGEGESSTAHVSINYAAVSSCMMYEGEDASASPLHGDTAFNFPRALKRMDSLRPGFETLVRQLASSPVGVSFLITDSFVLWGQQVASDLNIPSFTFYTTNAHAFITALHAPTIVAKGLTDPEQLVDCIPGMSIPVRVRELPQSIRFQPSFAMSITENLGKAAGLILNSVLELEKEPLEVIRTKVRAVYTIGPMPLMLGSSASSPLSTSRGPRPVGLWVEQRECLEWLSARPEASVLFIAFGSLANMDGNQMKQLAEGLEASEQAFLWVIRSASDSSRPSSLLPKGFMERTQERGLIISWAPQLEVLSHPAVGAFLTHCGWNSVTENLSLGAVPMICWPQLAEQSLNTRLLVDKWRVGLELPLHHQQADGGKAHVNSTEVEEVVRQVMQGALGKELRRRALEHKATILAAVQEGGSSRNNLKAMGEDIKRLASKPQFYLRT